MPEEAKQPTSVDELTVTREGDDRMAQREELKKKVLTSGAWATLIYQYKEMVKKKDGKEWSKPKLSLVRYRKLKGSYRFQKEFALSNMDHARQVRDTISEWLAEDEAAAEGSEDEGEAKAEE